MTSTMKYRARATAGVLIASILAAAWLASGASANDTDLPPNWHVHDGRTTLGPQHKGIGFFPTILGMPTSQYVEDPAECPDATDKAFLPSNGRSESEVLRAGMCQTSAYTIHLRTVRPDAEGPEGWSSLTTPAEPGWVTYYKVTTRG